MHRLAFLILACTLPTASSQRRLKAKLQHCTSTTVPRQLYLDNGTSTTVHRQRYLDNGNSTMVPRQRYIDKVNAFRSLAAFLGLSACGFNFAVMHLISALGFTVNGITEGSMADALRSIITFFNGDTISPDSVIITLQTIGIEGFYLSTKLMLGSIGALLCIIFCVKLRIF
ncbi:uncharacterized protein LOC144606734 [Rhinoraja longicauda]